LNHRDTESTEKSLPADLNELSARVIGLAIEVHRILGPGYLESVYEEALELELRMQPIRFERQKTVCVSYKGHEVGHARLDFFIEATLILELKAVDRLGPIHRAQMISYLKATGCRLGLVVNFNDKTLRDGIMRVAL